MKVLLLLLLLLLLRLLPKSVVRSGFYWRDVADRRDVPTMVEPRHTFERCKFGRFFGLPWSSPVDQLG